MTLLCLPAQTEALRTKLATMVEGKQQQGNSSKEAQELERLRKQLDDALREEERLRQQLVEVIFFHVIHSCRHVPNPLLPALGGNCALHGQETKACGTPSECCTPKSSAPSRACPSDTPTAARAYTTGGRAPASAATAFTPSF